MLFLDTNVVIDILGSKRFEVRRRFNEAKGGGARMLVSSIVLFELRMGASLSAREVDNNRGIDSLLADGVELTPFEAADAAIAGRLAADLRQSGRQIGPYDLLIAAQALRFDATLVTHNIREFARVAGLSAIDWAI